MTRRRPGVVVALAMMSLAHVGSPDTFFGGKAGPYDVRVSVRLPGVIPGRAQVTIRVEGQTRPDSHHVTVRAAQWNVGLKGAPPPETAATVNGDPALHAAELWFMTNSSYQLAVEVDGPAGKGSVLVPVLALATAERTMPPWLGWVLAALGVVLTLGLLTIIGGAVRESVLPPGEEPDSKRRWRARIGVALTAILAALALWGGNVWWSAEASDYKQAVLYRPFNAVAAVAPRDGRQMLSLGIRDKRWTAEHPARSRYNALLPDHGKLMHLFLVCEPELDSLVHLHPVARTPAGLDFDADLPPVAAGRYRLYADIVHESGYAQTMVSSVEIGSDIAAAGAPTDADDSWISGVGKNTATSFDLGDGSRVVWERDGAAVAGAEKDLRFVVQDASGAEAQVEPYMGMAAHLVVASRDGSVFAHLHPSGSISMAAMQRFAGESTADPHAGHVMDVGSRVAVPYAFPKAGAYRVFVQVKRGGIVKTAAFDVDVTDSGPSTGR